MTDEGTNPERFRPQTSTGRALHLLSLPAPTAGWSLVIHGGAEDRSGALTVEEERGFATGLAAAYRAGEKVLVGGGSAEDAVCAAVVSLEDDPLFNSGRGAALTLDGTAQLDASLMLGDGRAGAVAASPYAKNPILFARAVLERTPHVLLAAPDRETIADLGCDVVDPSYFVTQARLERLAEVKRGLASADLHGTVGAVARDRSGHLAAATSTGGISLQWQGRVGDTPIIGAGTYAQDGVSASSCTGHGEYFVEGVIGHDVAARIAYGRMTLPEAVRSSILERLEPLGGDGGIIAVGASGAIVVAHNSTNMFAAYRGSDGRLVTETDGVVADPGRASTPQ